MRNLKHRDESQNHTPTPTLLTTTLHRFSRTVVLNRGNFTPRGHLELSADTLVVAAGKVRLASLLGRGQRCCKHPTMHRIAPQQRTIQPKMSTVRVQQLSSRTPGERAASCWGPRRPLESSVPELSPQSEGFGRHWLCTHLGRASTNEEPPEEGGPRA